MARALALAYHENGAEYRESIAVLYIARLKGQRDPEFISIYGGMLVMDEQLGDAQEVWRRAAELNLTVADSNRIGFRPHPGNERVRLTGRVVDVKAGFAFVSVPGLPNFFWPGVRFGERRPTVGETMEFEPGFCARGPVVAELWSVSRRWCSSKWAMLPATGSRLGSRSGVRELRSLARARS